MRFWPFEKKKPVAVVPASTEAPATHPQWLKSGKERWAVVQTRPDGHTLWRLEEHHVDMSSSAERWEPVTVWVTVVLAHYQWRLVDPRGKALRTWIGGTP